MRNLLQTSADFLGRQEELQLLKTPNWRGHAELIVIYGRRRVGKTALVEHAFQDQPLWKFEGLEGDPAKDQIRCFLTDLVRYTGNFNIKNETNTWKEALGIFAKEISKKKITVFLDEFQWLASMKKSFVSLFKYYWDNYFRKNKNLRMILCGSISSFMVKKVLRSKALYGRVDTEIHLKPFSLPDIHRFFQGKRPPQEILQIAMILGGIPKYLEEIQPKWSFFQNLNELAFRQHGYLFQEYRRLFISHFSHGPLYEKILKALAQKPLTTEALAKLCQTKTGGSLTEKLYDLELAEFIDRYVPLNKGQNSKFIRYRLLDEYLHFYFRFILPYTQEIISGQFKLQSLFSTRNYQQWLGYAFERLCRKNAMKIADRLQFSGIRFKAGSWFQTKKKTAPGTQIDLLFERADKTLTVCEMKFTKTLQGQKIIRDFEKKIEALQGDYPAFAKQKVLILPEKKAVPENIRNYFDEILFASEIFFSGPLEKCEGI